MKSTYWSETMASTNTLQIAASPRATTIDVEIDVTEAQRLGLLLIAVMGLLKVKEAVFGLPV